MSSELSSCLLYGFSHCSLAFKQAQIVASALVTNSLFIRILCLSPNRIKSLWAVTMDGKKGFNLHITLIMWPGLTYCRTWAQINLDTMSPTDIWFSFTPRSLSTVFALWRGLCNCNCQLCYDATGI